jgi:hypothetical protein
MQTKQKMKKAKSIDELKVEILDAVKDLASGRTSSAYPIVTKGRELIELEGDRAGARSRMASDEEEGEGDTGGGAGEVEEIDNLQDALKGRQGHAPRPSAMAEKKKAPAPAAKAALIQKKKLKKKRASREDF